MRFRHRDGERAPGAKSLGPVRDTVDVDGDGVFEVDPGRDDYDDLVERLEAEGHEPLDDEDDEADTNTNGADDGAAPASAFSETELVEMDRNALRSIAAVYDDVDGNASGDALTEALIERRRAEVGGDE